MISPVFRRIWRLRDFNNKILKLQNYSCTLMYIFKPPKVCTVHRSNRSEVETTVEEGLDDCAGWRELGDEQEGVRVHGARHALQENQNISESMKCVVCNN